MMNRIMFASEQLMAAKSAVNRIEEVLNEKPLADPKDPKQPKDASVVFDHVSYSYPGTEKKPWIRSPSSFRPERPWPSLARPAAERARRRS